MATYDDALSLRDARDLYFRANDFGPDGGYSSKWVTLDLLGMKIKFPNTAARKKAVVLHDLHHVLTDYQTDWAGEVEISAFEIAAGCGEYSAAWMLNLQALFIGMFTNPVRMFRAFRRGRRSRSLYHQGYDDALLTRSVGELRNHQEIAEVDPPARVSDALAFGGWWLVSAAVGLVSLAILLSPILLLVWAFA